VDHNTVETIDDLQCRLDNAASLSDTYHGQLVEEREGHTGTRRELTAALERIMSLEHEKHLLDDQLVGLETRRAEEQVSAVAALEAARSRAEKDLESAHSQAEMALEQERCSGAERLALAEALASKLAGALRQELGEEKRERAAEVEGVRAEAVAALGEARQEGERVVAALKAEAAKARVWLRGREGALAGLVAAGRRALELEAKGELGAAVARGEEEKEGRRKERDQKEAANAKVARLTRELEAGRAAALSAIADLKARGRAAAEQAQWTLEQMQEEHSKELSQLRAEFRGYKEEHSVPDSQYHSETEKWAHKLTVQKSMVGDLKVRVDELEKTKRSLEREKTFLW
ncbi:unnamed protein product, partial [Discosporangium mesarthrocarpum]